VAKAVWQWRQRNKRFETIQREQDAAAAAGLISIPFES
jgi:hypothetical protein